MAFKQPKTARVSPTHKSMNYAQRRAWKENYSLFVLGSIKSQLKSLSRYNSEPWVIRMMHSADSIITDIKSDQQLRKPIQKSKQSEPT
jgi:hypothetical protein